MEHQTCPGGRTTIPEIRSVHEQPLHGNRIASVGALKPVIPATFMGGMTRSDGEEVRDCPDVPVSDFSVWQRV